MLSALQTASPAVILLVDDNPNNLRLLSRMLAAEGFTVRKALNGKLAIQGATRNPPNLILLDINMPEMSGYEVCQQLKADPVTCDIPIIFISALNCIDDKVRAFEIGGQDYITKPFQELEVLVRVKNQLLIQQQYQQLLQQNQQLEQEIAERLKAEAEVKRLSLTDDLTGLCNRRGFFLLAEQQLKIARRTQTSCCLLFADLDGLKQINDTLGHEVGDRAIAEAAQLLKQTFRDADIVARLGGDEFVVLIPTCSDNVDEFQHRLQTSVDRFNQRAGSEDTPLYQLSISVGVVCCVVTEELSLEKLLVQADQLMYYQKRDKHSRARFSFPEHICDRA